MARPPHVLITGGSRGIGLAIAQLFAKNAYRCTLISRSEEDLKAAVATLKPIPSSTPSSTSNEQPRTLPDTVQHSVVAGDELLKPITPDLSASLQHGYMAGDITHATLFWTTAPSGPFAARLPRPASTKTPPVSSRIDVVVNCAGRTQAKLFSAQSEEEIDEIIKANLNAMMHGTRFLLRHGYLKRSADAEKAHDPVVINVSSLLGLHGGYGAVAYAAAKAGVLGFTRALATEYASHKVRVNAIVPGYVETNMTKDLDKANLEKRIPLGRFGSPEEIAHAALFLAQNKYAHNCVVNLDGGLSAV
ncbi:FabG Dehydrogenase with different specificities related to short-chain alcohol dehydrogenase [Pyrenophora tritici-repentis]|uniref:FabG, Dehydrogenase with different specificities (Related to short-chain alcohol dehydrogenase) n=2 Tax=Pyrenophora tritici-repentis TaxID=45151 RepID=A0A2W1H901_9PLEO|nr:3-oxoacyl-(acyl carrier protein) reductase [Pyrenophora tritici-repentis Pt-1C-BFP]KAA8625441.1 Quinone reductase [Pyrenophora tritici-repentis]EDU40253.1 3-oxoacyl-(acyl carrier protein) reductase [Pyrenophora tritici-repentis Pt-1C-BFP]KAF7453841.1 Quinone reductase [Pyrenophora tritici-repentis]KAF7576934.1 FabG, Dehydrogenase with different specificities (related to short-chain alcohol dehydrogenase) [Pyrenophora tritici-repentis]KAG9387602.1 Quinone reductase [Pyrenophora tritici-repen